MTALFGILLLALASAAGRTVLRLMRVALPTRLDRLIFSSALGLGIIAYGVLALGLMGGLSAIPVTLFLLGLAAVSLRGWNELAGDIRGIRLRRGGGAIPPPGRLLCGIAVGSFATMALLSCFVPPGAHEWDALSYHLAAPKVYLEHGRIVYLPTDHHSNFPFNMQMLFAVGLLYGGYPLANLMHWLCALLTGAGIYAIGRRHFSPAAALIALVAFASTPMAIWEAGTAYTELGLALYVLLGFGALLEHRAQRYGPWPVIAGILMGLALSVKTLALIPLAIALLALLIWKTPLRPVLLFLACSLLIGAPYYVKSWILTGNPVYPFAYRVFGGRDWSPELAATYASEHVSFGQSGFRTSVRDDAEGLRARYAPPGLFERLRNLILIPFDLVAVPRVFHNYNDPGMHSHLGFLAVSLPFLLLLARGASPAAHALGAVALVWFLLWSQSMQYARYLLPLTPLACLAGGEAAARLADSRRLFGCFLGAGLALQAGVALWHFGSRAPEQWDRATDPAARAAYLVRSVNVYESQQWINRNAPPGAGVVLFEETRGFYLNRPYLWGNGPHSLYIPYHAFRTGQEMANWFLARGYRYGLVNLHFSPRIQTQEDYEKLADAIRAGIPHMLVAAWYFDERRLAEVRVALDRLINSGIARPGQYRDEYWRLLLGDALLNGGAVPVPEAGARGAVVLEWRPKP